MGVKKRSKLLTQFCYNAFTFTDKDCSKTVNRYLHAVGQPKKNNPCLIHINVSKLFVIIFQELVSDKEEGLHMLQISLDNLQIVLPNTSVAGRDSMRREMQVLQSEYDGLSADINDLKTKLDSTLTQWTVYDDSIEQLGRWLRDLEDQLEAESQLQNTLQEKKLQQERVKVC